MAKGTIFNETVPLVGPSGEIDRTQLEGFLDHYQNSFYGYAYRLLGNRSDGHDALAEMLFRVLRAAQRGGIKARTYPGLRLFCVRTLYRCCVDIIREHDAVTPIEDAGLSRPDRCHFDQSILSIDLARALLELPALTRQAVLLTDVEGMSHAQAAEIMRLSLSTFRRRLEAGHDQLRTLLQASHYLA